MAATIRIGLMYSDALMSEARQMLLGTQEGFDVVFSTVLPEETLQKLPDLSLDVLVIDARLRGSSGVEFALRLQRRYLGSEVSIPKIILTAPFFSEQILLEAIRAGVNDLVTEEDGPKALIKAITSVMSRDNVTDFRDLKTFFQQTGLKAGSNPKWLLRLDNLEEQEQQVLEALEHGLKEREMAEKLGITSTRVRWAVESLMARLAVATRAQLALALYEAGVLYADYEEPAN